MDDAPIQRTLRVGTTQIGLVGLDQAINTALSRQLPEEAAGDFLFQAIAGKNYIPQGLEGEYTKALTAEYQRHLGTNTTEDTPRLVIRILGPACVSCNRLYTMSIDILQKHGIVADIISISDLDEIWRYGVTATPALIINDVLKSSGRLPTFSEIEAWIRTAADR